MTEIELTDRVDSLLARLSLLLSGQPTKRPVWQYSAPVWPSRSSAERRLDRYVEFEKLAAPVLAAPVATALDYADFDARR